MTSKTFNLTSQPENVANKKSVPNSQNGAAESYKTEKRRWLMLAIFICFTFINSVQWGLYVVISDLVQKYYGVSGDMVDNTAVVFSLAYIPLIFPALWLLDKMGIRFCLLLSCAGLCAGDWIKVIASLDKNLFYLVLVGQGVVATFGVLTFGLAAKLAAVWFAADQVSSACSFAVFGDQLGTAFGLFLPAVLVTNDSEQSIGTGLVHLNILIACYTTFIFFATLLLFRRAPATPPSAAQALATRSPNISVLTSVKTVCKNKSFLSIMIAYGLQVASYSAYAAIFNSIMFKYFPTVSEIHIGLISSLMLVSGIVGSILSGWLLDKTHVFKGLNFILYLCLVLTSIANTYVPAQLSLELVYASNILLGFFLGGYYSAGVQLAIEITFPVSESLVSSLLLFAAQCLTILFTKLLRWIFDDYGYDLANIFICGALIVGCCLIAFTPVELQRTAANEKHLTSSSTEELKTETIPNVIQYF